MKLQLGATRLFRHALASSQITHLLLIAFESIRSCICLRVHGPATTRDYYIVEFVQYTPQVSIYLS
jgi:hypothetical protein